ncbi:hypothetical protein Tco_0333038 [Tanacetum coccineum]
MAVNNLYQPWREILSMINQCLTGKTSGFDRPRYPVIQMLWGIITTTNVDYVELMWKEFVQAMQTFLVDKANLSIPPQKGKKTKPHVIPYCWFTKLIICHLGRTHNIHQRSASPFHLVEKDHKLGNLKFIPKGKDDEVFGMQIPNEVITNNIKNAPYYNAYLEMVAKHDQKTTAQEGGKKKSATKADKSKKPATAKQLKPKPVKEKSSKPAPALKPNVTQEKPAKPSHAKHPKMGKVRKIHKGKSYLQLTDEDEPTQPKPESEPEHQGEAEATRPLPVVEGKGKAISTEEQAAQSLLALHTPKRRSTTDQFIFQKRTPTTEEESTGPFAQPQDDASTNIVRDYPSPVDAEIGVDTDKRNSGGDNEILQIGEELCEDVANVVDQEEKTAEINEGQAGSDPDLGLSHVALAGPDPEPMHDDFVTTVYPQVHESLKHPDEEHVYKENPLSFTGTLSSIKNMDVFHFVDRFFNDKPTEEDSRKTNMEIEVESTVIVLIHEASSSVPPLTTPVIDLLPPKLVPSTTQAPIFTATTTTTTITLTLSPPLQQQRTTDSELVARASTEQENREELLAEKDKSRKRHRDDQDPHPLPDSDLSKKKRYDYDASEAPSSSSKQKSTPHSKQPVEDVPIPDAMNISNLEDTDTAHLPKIKTKPDCWYQDPDEYKLLRQTGDMSSFINWFCKQIGKKKLSKMEECHLLLTDQVDLVNPEGHRVVPDVSKPLPLRGPPERRSALSISKLKAANYPDFRLKELVPSLWIESEREYDISVAYADYNEYKISEADFKNLHPNDFEDVYLLHLHGQLNHLSGCRQRSMYARRLEVHSSVMAMLNLGFEKLDHMVKDSSCSVQSWTWKQEFWSKDDIRRSPTHYPVVLPEHSEWIHKYQSEDGNPARANIKQALGR